MNFYLFVLGALSVWRITHLLQAEDGPWDVVVRLRRVAGSGFWGELMDCFYCLSMWIAAPVAIYLGLSWGERILLWPALSAAAILLERTTDKEQKISTVQLIGESEDNHVMLWKEKNTVKSVTEQSATR